MGLFVFTASSDAKFVNLDPIVNTVNCRAEPPKGVFTLVMPSAFSDVDGNFS